MKELGKLLVFFFGTLVLGACLAPPLFWIANDLAAHGVFPGLAEFSFRKYFNRAALLSAGILLWPMIRWLRIGGWQDLGIFPDSRKVTHFFAGFGIAASAVAIMGAAYVQFGFYRWKGNFPVEKIGLVAVSAIVVATLEELLFRGVIFGLLRRSLRSSAALFWTTLFFAVVHFLKPDDRVKVASVQWSSGFELVPHTFHQFAEPATLLAGFLTLFALGWLCGEAAARTRALWMSIGLHAGVVFVKMSFSLLTKRREIFLPWVGRELQLGLVPVGLLLLALLAVRLWLAWEGRQEKSSGTIEKRARENPADALP